MDQKKPSGRSAGNASPRPAAKPAARPAAKLETGPAGKPAAKPKPSPGDGLLGWLGRQVGHVSKAVKADVTKPAGKRPAASPSTGPAKRPTRPAPANRPPPARGRPVPGTAGPAAVAAAEVPPPADPKETVIYRTDKVEVAEMPDRPGVILRRTIIDEVVVETETPEKDGR